MSRRAIAVFGSSQPLPGEPAYIVARDIGAALGASGFDVINGGHEGVMAAVSAGARSGGGQVLGVTCRAVRDARGAVVNRFIQELIDAPTLWVRIEIMMRRAGGYVFLPGGTGTLAELSVVWEHVAKGLIARRPIVFVGDAWAPVVATVGHDTVRPCLHRAQTIDDVVAILVDNAIDLPETERNFTAGKDIIRVNE